MGMKKKLKLNDLKVQSFITALSEHEKLAGKGGEILDVIGEIPQTQSICLITCGVGMICTIYNPDTKQLSCIGCKPR